MFRQTKSEHLQEESRTHREEIAMYERIYQKGAGCFGVGRKSPEIKKKLKELRGR
jgi:hypothetical protein